MKGHNRFAEPLTVDNAAVLLVDHQVGLISGVRDIPLAELKHNVVGLAKAAQVLGLPIVVTSLSTAMWGPLSPELQAVLPDGLPIISRSIVNAWHDQRVKESIEATGRTKLIVAGIALEVCVALAAIAATGDGYDAYAAIDASGTFWAAKREAGILRMQQAGVIVTDYCTAMVEILADNALPVAGDVYAALDMPFAVLFGQIAEGLTKG